MIGYEHLLRQIRGAKVPVVRINWRMYFRDFCQQHGPPLTHGGRLLFPDGWTYSATDWKGPEWAPPEDPIALAMLVRRYWKLRRVAVLEALTQARLTLASCVEAQSARSATLQQIIKYMDPDTGRLTTVERPLDLEGMEQRVESLRLELMQAEEHIVEENCRLKLLRMGDEVVHE